MENDEVSQSSEQTTEQAYPVRLRPPVFSFIAESLRPVYQADLEKVQQDGSFKGLQEFHASSRMGRLMGAILDQYENTEEVPDNPTLNLSNEDMAFLGEKISRSADAARMRLRSEMMGELGSAFTQAKLRAKATSLFEGAKSKIKGKG